MKGPLGAGTRCDGTRQGVINENGRMNVGECRRCGKRVGAYRPKGGDGSLVVARSHKPKDGKY